MSVGREETKNAYCDGLGRGSYFAILVAKQRWQRLDDGCWRDNLGAEIPVCAMILPHGEEWQKFSWACAYVTMDARMSIAATTTLGTLSLRPLISASCCG